MRGKTAFLPGGYGGTGEAIAWALAMRGARVVVAGRSQAKAGQLAEAINNKGFIAAGLEVAVQSVAAIQSVVDEVVETFGTPEIFVNCVGIQREEPLLEVTEEAYDDVEGGWSVARSFFILPRVIFQDNLYENRGVVFG